MGSHRRKFGSWRMHGGRYDQFGLPVEALSEFARYERLVVDVARGLYLNSHKTRQRVPGGFAQAFSLRLTSVSAGSVIPELEAVTPTDPGLIGSDYFDIFDQARTLIQKTLKAVEIGDPIPRGFPPHALSEFASFGRSLRDDEFIEFDPGTPNSATYSQAIRRSLQEVAKLERFEVETQVIGQVTGLMADKGTFEFRLAGNGRAILGHFSSPDLVIDLKQFLDVSEMAPTVALIAVAIKSRFDDIVEIQDILSIEPMLPPEWSERLLQLSKLGSGWLDGGGNSIERSTIRQAELLLLQLLDDRIERPGIFPTEKGAVQFEWANASGEVTVRIAEDHTIEYYAYSKVSEEEAERTFGWNQLDDVADAVRGGIQSYVD